MQRALKKNGADVNLINVSSASEADVKDADVVALGSPAMGAEVIEESEMEPFVESISGVCLQVKTCLIWFLWMG